MQSSQIVGCSNCGTLKSIYNEIECTIVDLIKRKWTNAQYNTELKFNQELFNDLVRYKRVVYKRLFNPAYPSSCIDAQDIISQVKTRAYKSGDCSLCTECFSSDPDTTTTSTSSTTTIA